jgi:hypothetical protein
MPDLLKVEQCLSSRDARSPLRAGADVLGGTCGSAGLFGRRTFDGLHPLQKQLHRADTGRTESVVPFRY